VTVAAPVPSHHVTVTSPAPSPRVIVAGPVHFPHVAVAAPVPAHFALAARPSPLLHVCVSAPVSSRLNGIVGLPKKLTARRRGENLLKTQLSCKSLLMVVSELCLISEVLRLIM
jgi:hypothetical protein